ncbi:Ig-like domain-containing protein [Butyrivibrio sp. MC2013]|uniref:Ig-like domain-containing protein n=1 Tax=Butyrivibrio sp. MC2013 TaxID=1280686 RepID=UPI00040C5F50|nr:Ig-like domain-containing protein [Butyrivibrio sp. MC2013]
MKKSQMKKGNKKKTVMTRLSAAILAVVISLGGMPFGELAGKSLEAKAAKGSIFIGEMKDSSFKGGYDSIVDFGPGGKIIRPNTGLKEILYPGAENNGTETDADSTDAAFGDDNKAPGPEDKDLGEGAGDNNFGTNDPKDGDTDSKDSINADPEADEADKKDKEAADPQDAENGAKKEKAPKDKELESMSVSSNLLSLTGEENKSPEDDKESIEDEYEELSFSTKYLYATSTSKTSEVKEPVLSKYTIIKDENGKNVYVFAANKEAAIWLNKDKIISSVKKKIKKNAKIKEAFVTVENINNNSQSELRFTINTTNTTPKRTLKAEGKYLIRDLFVTFSDGHKYVFRNVNYLFTNVNGSEIDIPNDGEAEDISDDGRQKEDIYWKVTTIDGHCLYDIRDYQDKDIWYSKSLSGKDLLLTVDCNWCHPFTQISSVNSEIDIIELRYTDILHGIFEGNIPLDNLAEGVNMITFAAKEHSKTSEFVVPFKIDNTAPRTDLISVTLNGNFYEDGIFTEEITADPSSLAARMLYSNKPISLALSYDNETQKAESNAAESDVVTIGIVMEDGSVNYLETDGSASYDILMENGRGDVIKQIILEDEAGNKSSFDWNLGLVYDNTSPVIEFDKVTDLTEKTTISGKDAYFTKDESWSGSFRVIDSNYHGREDSMICLDNEEGIYSASPVLKEALDSEYSYTFSREGVNGLSVKAVDMAGNESDIASSDLIIIDNTAPLIRYSYSAGGKAVSPEGSDKSYYNKDVEVTISVEELYPDFEENTVGIAVTRPDKGTEYRYIKPEDWVESAEGDKRMYSAVITTNADGEYYAFGTVRDRAGNISSNGEAILGESFTVDKTDPLITVSYDNNDALEGRYYKDTRTATIVVEDYTFDPERTLFTDSGSGKAKLTSFVKNEDGRYSMTAVFDTDGDYSFSFTATDKAGNKAEPYIEKEEFTIDKTKPVISISFDKNGKDYYNETRTATVTIKEHNFDPSKVRIKGADNTSAFSQGQSYINKEDEHSISIVFDTDGIYAFTVDYTDRAGNEAEEENSGSFTIDKTAPVISFMGVSDREAIRGTASPVVICEDSNMGTDVSMVLTGSMTGLRDMPFSRQNEKEKVSVSYSDFGHVRDNDDVYTINVTARDLAGNVTEDMIVFSVNRFGSTFYLHPESAVMTERYFTNAPTDLVVEEVNVDAVNKKTLTIGRDDEIMQVKEGKGWSSTESVNEYGWHSVTYTVSKELFDKEGDYTVLISTTDAAGNNSSNRAENLEFAFAVDKTAPGLAFGDLEEGAGYESETGHDFSLSVDDNRKLVSAAVYINGDLAGEYKAGDDLGINKSLHLESLDKAQNVRVVAADAAGNSCEKVIKKVYVSAAPKELIRKSMAEIDDEVSPLAMAADLYPGEIISAQGALQGKAVKKEVIILIFAAAMLLGAGIAALIAKRKNVKKD